MYRINNYVEALYLISKEFNNEDEILNDSKNFLLLVEKTNELEQFFNSKIYTNLQKNQIIDSIEGFSPYFINFLKVLNIKNDQKYLKDILLKFEQDYLRRRNIVVGTIYSPKELKQDFLVKLEKTFSKKIAKEVQLKNVINSSLISGIKINLDGKVYNYSIQGKLESVKEELLRR